MLKALGTPKYLQWRQALKVRVILITRDLTTPYSGMLPGYTAGHYTYDEIHLNLAELCQFSKIELVVASVNQIEYNESDRTGLVYSEDSSGKALDTILFHALSINIGSAPSQKDLIAQQPDLVVPVKPIANFCNFFERKLPTWQSNERGLQTLAVVGGGAGGIELALSIQYRLRATGLKVILLTRGSSILQDYPTRVRRKLQMILVERDIPVYCGATVVGVDMYGKRKKLLTIETVQSKTGPTATSSTMIVDDVLWCASAGVGSWLANNSPLACTTGGFVRVRDTYQSVSHECIFAVGDCCHHESGPRPKAGVWAVRAGPPLLSNLEAFLSGDRHLISHDPPKTFLSLISTGNQYAVASKSWWLCADGGHVWRWKDWIDRRWMAQYKNLGR